MSDSFLLPEIMGSPKLTNIVLLTVFIFIIPTVQTIWLSALKFFHPVIKDIEMDKNDKVNTIHDYAALDRYVVQLLDLMHTLCWEAPAGAEMKPETKDMKEIPATRNFSYIRLDEPQG